jgi:hypothetical protein
VFAAVRARGGRVIDLAAMGLQPALNACANVRCRRSLATRRGAEWHVVVVDDGATVALDLLDGEVSRAHVVLTGSRVVLLGGVPDAVDALFESALPRVRVDRARAVAQARAAEDRGDLEAALRAWEAAFALENDDRAVEIAFARARVAEEAGDELALERAWVDAERLLLATPELSIEARELLSSALLEYRWERAERSAAIAVADTGPDHDALAADAAHQFDRLAASDWVPAAVRQQARAAADAARPCTATVEGLPSTSLDSEAMPTTSDGSVLSEPTAPAPAATPAAGDEGTVVPAP